MLKILITQHHHISVIPNCSRRTWQPNISPQKMWTIHCSTMTPLTCQRHSILHLIPTARDLKLGHCTGKVFGSPSTKNRFQTPHPGRMIDLDTGSGRIFRKTAQKATKAGEDLTDLIFIALGKSSAMLQRVQFRNSELSVPELSPGSWAMSTISWLNPSFVRLASSKYNYLRGWRLRPP